MKLKQSNSHDTETLKRSGYSETGDSPDIEKPRISRNRETNDTQDTRIIPLVVRINTVPEAVAHSLAVDVKSGKAKGTEEMEFGVGLQRRVFEFCRALKAFEITTNRRIPPNEMPGHFAAWYNAAKIAGVWADGLDYDEVQFDFLQTFAATKTALGSNPIEEAIRRAESLPAPKAAGRFEGRIHRLVCVCYHLQQIAGTNPFFIGARGAAKASGIANYTHAWKMLCALTHPSVGILRMVEKGRYSKNNDEEDKATRWLWIAG